MRYRDFYDDFPYADTLNITGLTSETGHSWIGSGANLPQILNNALQITLVGGGGHYAFVDVLRPPDYQWADIVWDDISQPGIVLMASRRGNNLDYMTHFRFTNTLLSLQMRGLGDVSPVTPPDVSNSAVTMKDSTIEYTTPVVAGREYRVGVRHYGSLFILELPGGQEYQFSHEKFADVVGRYLCFQPLGARTIRAGCTLHERRYL